MSKAAELANLIGNINAGGGGVNRNVIINGAMNVAQRATSSSGLGAATGYFTCDRWNLYQNGTAGRLTMSQDNDAPEGFSKSLKFACTTADTSIASGESLQIMHKMEAQNLQQFKKGTSSALPFALSFYVKGNASATYVAELEDYDNSSRHVGKTFNVTTDWTRVEITFPADTTGVLGEDNGTGIALNIHLHSGSFNTGGTLQQTWGTLSQADRVGGGTTSFFDSTDRTFFITGVQLEVGQNATEFEHEPFERTLEKCQRYFLRKTVPQGYMNGMGNTAQYESYDLPVTMRADGTGSVSTTVRYWSGSTATSLSGTVSVYPKTNHVIITAGNLTDGNGYIDGVIDCDAEL